MHTGLAEQLFTCLRGFSAFPTCSFPLCVSASGRLDVLEVLTPFLSRVTREFHMHRHGAPNPPEHPDLARIPAAETVQGDGESLSRQRDVAEHGTRSPGSPLPGSVQRSDERYSVACGGDGHSVR